VQSKPADQKSLRSRKPPTADNKSTDNPEASKDKMETIDIEKKSDIQLNSDTTDTTLKKEPKGKTGLGIELIAPSSTVQSPARLSRKSKSLSSVEATFKRFLKHFHALVVKKILFTIRHPILLLTQTFFPVLFFLLVVHSIIWRLSDTDTVFSDQPITFDLSVS